MGIVRKFHRGLGRKSHLKIGVYERNVRFFKKKCRLRFFFKKIENQTFSMGIVRKLHRRLCRNSHPKMGVYKRKLRFVRKKYKYPKRSILSGD
jgi:hypothetical protein